MKQHHIEFLLLVRKFRFALALIMLMAFLASLYFLSPLVLRYSSYASFYVVADKLYNPASAIVQDNVSITEYSLENKRIENLIYSTEMIDYLVKNYNLYHRYQIDSTARFSKEMMANQIRNNVRLNKTSSDFFLVYVYDRNNEIAAAMANSIVKQLDLLNRHYIKNKVNINLRMYREFNSESNKMNEEHSRNLKVLLSEIKNAKTGSLRNDQMFSDIEFSLHEAMNKISEITIQNLNSQAYLFNSIKMMDQSNSPTIVMVGRALPDTSSARFFLVLYSVGVALTFLVVSVSVLYLTYNYKKELSILFGR
jgi:hypothetical protein